MKRRAPFRGLGAVLYKEFLVMLRDPTTLFFMFVPPLLQIIAFGFALDMDVRNLWTVVLDEDRTRESRRFIEQFENTGTYRVVGEVQTVEELATAIRQGRARVGLQIPPDFSRHLRAGRPAQAQVLIDGSNSSTAQQALNTGLQIAFRESALQLLGDRASAVMPIEVRPQMLYNPDMKSPNFYLPGVIGIALQIATVFATAMSVVRERERGTIETLLVSPVSRWGMMLGKIVPYLCVSMAMAFSLFLVLRWVFLVRIQGSVLFLFGASLLYIFALLSLGLLISTRAQNQMQALQMTMTIMLPTIFFSGFIFPRETMPWIFYAISTILPATYFIELMRAIILRGATFADFGHYLAILAGMGILLFVVASLRFRRRLA
jgi:ABC-type multidrug transport system permease subunit